jgi:hypothetical protein
MISLIPLGFVILLFIASVNRKPRDATAPGRALAQRFAWRHEMEDGRRDYRGRRTVDISQHES